MRVPAHAATSSTVDLVRRHRGAGAARFANAVLRAAARHDRAGWVAELAPDRDRDPDGYLAVATSHPEWIVRAFRTALRTWARPPGELDALLAADNEPAAVTLAALPGLVSVEDLLTADGRRGSLSPVAVAMAGPPGEVAAIREARARVQDEGSQAVTLALADAPIIGPDGGQWLDLCAGPGGKAALLAAELAARSVPQGRLVAVEAAEHRVGLVRSATRAVQERTPDLVDVRYGDGREAAEPSAFDRVLVDVPCTGLGALRRRPEARWRRTPADLAQLGPLQRGLLDAALDAARPGGVVGYVTCSPHPAETRAVVDDVLRRRDRSGRPGAQRLDARPVLGAVAARAGGNPDLGPGPDVQLWPHLHGTDAMYLALLRRSEEGSA
jgi:16S rRNA (cytosine967-C5)-methyltransferase